MRAVALDQSPGRVLSRRGTPLSQFKEMNGIEAKHPCRWLRPRALPLFNTQKEPP
jgi:hypothetical protein